MPACLKRLSAWTQPCKIRDAGKVRARDRIAVLAALNLAFELPDRTAEAPAPQDVRSRHANFPDGDPALLLLLERLIRALGDDGRLTDDKLGK